ncbi:TPA: methyltransferase [Candidatus Komeilibacteria bacterium]|nr:MAG: hypothetical protein A3J95_02810 [Candidatus Komeilibacteria bacterium RIFOXYC2_FULL_45_12]OGY94861.1 MAG: hypothetical protein A2260_02110 [Candidatus Komeilibacteria bacterium RIFOXYA2_FULL_45_9]HAH04387.1 methyltransferase [Candidatus Komeilibacteria bacterium]HBR13495.1 methyltransferase [Candidatus Komeilibacteria bacterium]HBV01891.1 methyltransferase [Candidatus Komeilibacteria bacterium]
MKLHLGCWKRDIPGFTNVDLADYPHIDYHRQVDDLSCFADQSAELIYASHVLEYFADEDAPQVLREWHRVLQPGATLRLAVPDFEGLVKAYQKYHDLDLFKGTIYGLMDIRHTDGQRRLLHHKTIYDFKSLKRLLESAGFGNVRRYDWRLTIHKDYPDHSMAYVPSGDYENGVLVSLNVEADKVGEWQGVVNQMKTQVQQFSRKVVNKMKREYRKF